MHVINDEDLNEYIREPVCWGWETKDADIHYLEACPGYLYSGLCSRNSLTASIQIR